MAERSCGVLPMTAPSSVITAPVGAVSITSGNITGISGVLKGSSYNIQGGIDKVIPVDVYVPGCAARPESIIDGVVQGIAALEAIRKKTA